MVSKNEKTQLKTVSKASQVTSDQSKLCSSQVKNIYYEISIRLIFTHTACFMS